MCVRVRVRVCVWLWGRVCSGVDGARNIATHTHTLLPYARASCFLITRTCCCYYLAQHMLSMRISARCGRPIILVCVCANHKNSPQHASMLTPPDRRPPRQTHSSLNLSWVRARARARNNEDSPYLVNNFESGGSAAQRITPYNNMIFCFADVEGGLGAHNLENIELCVSAESSIENASNFSSHNSDCICIIISTATYD